MIRKGEHIELDIVVIPIEGPHVANVMEILPHVEIMKNQWRLSLGKDLPSHLVMVSMIGEIMKMLDRNETVP